VRHACRSLGLVGFALLAAAFGAEAAETADSAGMAVSVIKAKSTCFVDTLQLTGTIVAREEALVRPDVEGLRISRFLVEDGAVVSRGQALAQLIRPDWMPGTPTSLTLIANANGTVMRRPFPIGTPASARGEPIFRIIKDGELELLAEVPQSAVGKIRAGLTARIESLGVNDLAGTLRAVDPDIDPLSQLGHVHIQVRGKPNVRPGAFAKATIDAGRTCSPSVPLSAVLYGAQGSVVQVVLDNKIETRRVHVGLLSGEDAEIRDGLKVGDLIVSKAGAFLREGDPVRPVLAEAESK